jgi:hypothetical protein
MTLVLENMQLEEEELTCCREVLALARSYIRGVFEYYVYGGSLSLPNYLRLLRET